MNLSNRISVPLEAYYRGKRIVLVRLTASGAWVTWNLSDPELDGLRQGKPVAIDDGCWTLGRRQFRIPSWCLMAVFGEEWSKIGMNRTDELIVRYHDHPYMKHLTHDELRQRYCDATPLVLSRTQDGKIGFMLSEKEVQWWNRSREDVKLADVYTECCTRYKAPHPPGLTPEHTVDRFPWKFSDDKQKMIEKLQGHLATLDFAKTIVRFDKAEHMRALYEQGEVFLKPASKYGESEMDGDFARQDNERRMETNVYKSTKKVVQCGNYWMYCMTKCTGDPIILNRLFGDFKATACVVIENIPAFFDRLNSQFRFVFPNTCRKWGLVRYVDPLLDELSEDDLPNLPMIKHFRFMYQHEFRYVAVPNNEVRERLEPKKLHLGPLRDIATYIGP